MKRFLFVFIFVIFLQKIAYANSLMDLYNSTISKYPSFKSYKLKNKSLSFDIDAINITRFINLKGEARKNLGNSINSYFIEDFITVNNNLDIFNKTKPKIEKINLEIEKNIKLINIEKKSIFLKLADEYFNILKEKKILEIHKKTLEWINKNIFIVESGIKGGIFPANEIDRWYIEKYKQENVIENDNLQIKKAFTILINYSDIENLGKIDDLKYIENLDLDLNTILINSPEFKINDILNKQIETDIEIENRNWLPELNLSNIYNLNSGFSFLDRNFRNNLNMTFSAILNFNILDVGKKARIDSLNSEIEFNKNDTLRIKKELYNDISQKILDIQNLKKQLINLKKIINISENNLNKLFIGYQKKFIDLNTLIVSYKENLLAQENYINTISDLQKNSETLYHLSKGDIY
ncbi:MAG: TolC family protein [Cyanobacteriota bacterium]